MRFGESIQRAAKQYRCDLCGHLITEGEIYERGLWMPIPGKLNVLRAHYVPGCPDPEDFKERELEEFVPTALAA